MILSFDKIPSVKGYFKEFLLPTFYSGEWVSTKKVYFRNAKDFYHWLEDMQRQCTGPCTRWGYSGELSDDTSLFTPLRIWEEHDFKTLLYYNDGVTYPFDFIK